MMRSRRTGAAALLVVLATAIAGCSSAAAEPPPGPSVDLGAYDPAAGNGLWLTSSAETADLIVDAVRRGGPVHIVGDVSELVQPDPDAAPVRGRSVALDFRGDATAFAARIEAGDIAVDILVSDGVARVRGNAAYAASQGVPESADRVVCTVGSDGVVEAWAPLLDPVSLVRSLLADASVHAQAPLDESDDPLATLDVVVGTEQAPSGVMTVLRFGAPLPQEFTAADLGGDGAFTFSGWGEPVDLAATEAALACP